eukprot:TRINITY_DN4137_c0_g1_i2.p1 TRINITY_DN4137_c0_g1~~TRINITY_DN4137_c0_g1_i2.p1  ORF type:complete len:295 (+),score=60.21 TRINITY_DN4137_c0_g1_i2:114-887(+)
MAPEIRDAVQRANDDDDVHVILVVGAGKAFCSGWDLKLYAEAPGSNKGYQAQQPWDPYQDYRFMRYATDCMMSLWRSHKPTIAQVHGVAVGGGSDIALCCDLVVMAEDAKIGYPPARLWGCPATGMWVYRLGAERAKRMLFTGDLITGTQAKQIGLVLDAVPADQLATRVQELVHRISSVPKNQLFFTKTMINSAIDNMGLNTTQTLSVLFDGMTRHSPEGVAFKNRCEQVGFQKAVKERDLGLQLAPASTTPTAKL